MNKELTLAEKVEFYANSSNMISANNGNRKTGKACLTLSFPTISCREDAPCKLSGKCYCLKGPQAYYVTVLGAYYRNWRLWNEDPKRFEEQVNAAICFNGLPLFRWCDAGDFPDFEFFLMTLRVARKNPEVKFMAYTKKYDLVNKYFDKGGKEFPENYTLRFSEWDKSWEVPNPHNLPIATVAFADCRKNTEIAKNAFWCKGGKETTCSSCRACWNKKIKQVVFQQH